MADVKIFVTKASPELCNNNFSENHLILDKPPAFYLQKKTKNHEIVDALTARSLFPALAIPWNLFRPQRKILAKCKIIGLSAAAPAPDFIPTPLFQD